MKIMAVTGSRADYSTIQYVYTALGNAGHKVFLESLHQPVGRQPTIGRETIQAMTEFTESLERRQPDLVVLAGDRFEILAAAVAANVARVPIAHLAGGDVTLGSQDDCMRHAITKLSQLHFPTHEEAAKRILALGEDESRVFTVGSPAIDRLMSTKLMDKDAAREKWMPEGFFYVLVNYQAPTLSPDLDAEVQQFFQALRELQKEHEVAMAFCTVNPDNDAKYIQREIEKFCAWNMNARMLGALSPSEYLSLLNAVDVLVGNSSSGIYEAPYLGTPVVNVGSRQDGRPLALNVTSIAPSAAAITAHLQLAIKLEKFPPHRIFGDGTACAQIVRVLDSISNPRSLLQKHPNHRWERRKAASA